MCDLSHHHDETVRSQRLTDKLEEFAGSHEVSHVKGSATHLSIGGRAPVKKGGSPATGDPPVSLSGRNVAQANSLGDLAGISLNSTTAAHVAAARRGRCVPFLVFARLE